MITQSLNLRRVGNTSDDAGGAFQIAEKGNRFQHYETKVAIPGHIQRGGSPTCRDRVLATELGKAVVETLLDDKNQIMVGKLHISITIPH